MVYNLGFVILTLLVSPWSWRILANSWWLLILVWVASILLYISVIKLKNLYMVFWLLMVMLAYGQVRLTKNEPLFYMTNTEEDLWNNRRRELSVINLSVGERWINVNLGKYLQGKQSFVMYKFQENMFRALDPNEYFFAGHPRERSGFAEFEKFNFVFLPFFVIGLYRAAMKKLWQLLASFGLPLLLISLVGADNPLGAFVFYPFLSVSIALGIKQVFRRW